MSEIDDDNGKTAVYFKLDTKLVEAIDYQWRKNQYRNRSAYIIDAINRYMEGARCPYCDAVNPPGGKICSLCMRPLKEGIKVGVSVTITSDEPIEVKQVDTEKEAERKGWKNMKSDYERIKAMFPEEKWEEISRLAAEAGMTPDEYVKSEVIDYVNENKEKLQEILNLEKK